MSQDMQSGHRGTAPSRKPGRIRGQAFWALVVLAFLILMLPNYAPSADPANSPGKFKKILEELHYKVDVWLWKEAVKARLRFEELGPDRFRAELAGKTQGFLSFITGEWQGSLSTEMTYSQGRLLPLVYREASQHRGKKHLSEYRFDYTQGKVELWKLRKDDSMTKRWETTFTEPMFDPLTMFYNRRLTANPVGKGGETVKYSGIPYPKPDEMILRIGPQTPEGRKIMADIENRVFENERSQFYAFLDNDGVPTKGWTRVLMFGNISMELLPGGKRVKREEVAALQEQARAGLLHQPSLK